MFENLVNSHFSFEDKSLFLNVPVPGLWYLYAAIILHFSGATHKV